MSDLVIRGLKLVLPAYVMETELINIHLAVPDTTPCIRLDATGES